MEYSDGMFLYGYVHSNPVAFRDPRGLWTQSCDTEDKRPPSTMGRWKKKPQGPKPILCLDEECFNLCEADCKDTWKDDCPYLASQAWEFCRAVATAAEQECEKHCKEFYHGNQSAINLCRAGCVFAAGKAIDICTIMQVAATLACETGYNGCRLYCNAKCTHLCP